MTQQEIIANIVNEITRQVMSNDTIINLLKTAGISEKAAENDTQQLKPIPTNYDGYSFRSRLEARWAVFFRCMGIRYQYEVEGLKLADGANYLPDFYLPDFKCYLEIKRLELNGTTAGNEAEHKIFSITGQNGCWGAIAYGDPYDDKCFEHSFNYKLRFRFGRSSKNFKPFICRLNVTNADEDYTYFKQSAKYARGYKF